MADFSIDGNMKVRTFKQQFKEAFGGTLRLYKGRNFADDDATLASIRIADSDINKEGDFMCRGNMKVSTFEEKVKEEFGITVQVANADNSKLADNSSTLSSTGE